MSEGDSIGELALLHDIRRAATIICNTTFEFLIVDKEDFNEVSFGMTVTEVSQHSD
jgi:CRP-like cAMP-binding protein